MKKRFLKPLYVACTSLVLILITFIFKPPVIGVADNGEFYRILSSCGLYSITGTMFNYVNTTYGIMNNGTHVSFTSTYSIFISIAVFFNKLLYSKTYFNLRFLSFIYSAMLICSAYMTLKVIKMRTKWINWLLVALVVLIIGDVGYEAYFNSFYIEAAEYSSFILAVSAYIYTISREKTPIWSCIIFFIALTLFTGLKQTYLIVALLGAILGLRLIILRKDVLWKILCITLSIFVLSTSALCFTVNSDNKINLFESVFYGVLKDSKTVDADLNALGLNKSLSPLANTVYYNANVQYRPDGEFMKTEFYNKISYTKIATFYATHPLRFINKMAITSNNAFRIVQAYLGNFEIPYANKTNINMYGIWSRAKMLIPNNIITVLVFFCLYFYFIIKERKVFTGQKGKKKNNVLFADLLLFITLTAIVAFVSPYITAGEADISKHLFMFNLSFDILLTAGLVWGAQNLMDRRGKLQEKFGVNQ
jgi:hypothetical protein